MLQICVKLNYRYTSSVQILDYSQHQTYPLAVGANSLEQL